MILKWFWNEKDQPVTQRSSRSRRVVPTEFNLMNSIWRVQFSELPNWPPIVEQTSTLSVMVFGQLKFTKNCFIYSASCCNLCAMMPRLKKVLKLQTLIPDLASSLVQFKVIPNHPTEPILPSDSSQSRVNQIKPWQKAASFQFLLAFWDDGPERSCWLNAFGKFVRLITKLETKLEIKQRRRFVSKLANTRSKKVSIFIPIRIARRSAALECLGIPRRTRFADWFSLARQR